MIIYIYWGIKEQVCYWEILLSILLKLKRNTKHKSTGTGKANRLQLAINLSNPEFNIKERVFLIYIINSSKVNINGVQVKTIQ